MIRIIIADDHKIFRQGLITMLESEKDITVEGIAKNGREALDLIKKFKPDVAIIDISMPELDGIEVARMTYEERVNTKVILLTMLKDSLTVNRAFNSHIHGYILKENAYEELVQAIRSVLSGGKYISPLIADMFIGSQLTDKIGTTSLTSREKEVLALIATGLKNKDISERLNISVKTVETYKSRIMQKLSLKSTTELLKYAVKKE